MRRAVSESLNQTHQTPKSFRLSDRHRLKYRRLIRNSSPLNESELARFLFLHALDGEFSCGRELFPTKHRHQFDMGCVGEKIDGLEGLEVIMVF